MLLEDLEGGNGVFLRIRTPVELEMVDEFVVGDQLLRIQRNPVPDDGPDPDPTYFYSSPKWPSSFRVTQMFEGGALGCCVVARGNTLQIGSAVGDLVFPDDPLVAEQHCLIEEQAGAMVLTDLGTRTGVFVRIRGEQELAHGDELLIGRTRLVVDLSKTRAALNFLFFRRALGRGGMARLTPFHPRAIALAPSATIFRLYGHVDSHPEVAARRGRSAARALKLSRNRFIVRTLEQELGERKEWSPGFLDLLRNSVRRTRGP